MFAVHFSSQSSSAPSDEVHLSVLCPSQRLNRQLSHTLFLKCKEDKGGKDSKSTWSVYKIKPLKAGISKRVQGQRSFLRGAHLIIFFFSHCGSVAQSSSELSSLSSLLTKITDRIDRRMPRISKETTRLLVLPRTLLWSRVLLSPTNVYWVSSCAMEKVDFCYRSHQCLRHALLILLLDPYFALIGRQ